MSNPVSVYFSYAWGDGESPEGQLRAEAADKLYQELKKRQDRGELTLVIDREHNTYKSCIREFTRRYSDQSILIIMIISEKYLTSEYCMGEVVEILSNKDYRDRIFPMVLPDAKLRDPIALARYYKYWVQRKKELRSALDGIEDEEYAIPLFEMLRDISEIIRIINNFTTELRSTITATPDNLQPLLDALDKYIRECAASGAPSSHYTTLAEYHAYTCDRVAQNDKFSEFIYGDIPPPKVNWYYLYGNSLQAHKSLCERLGRDVAGHLQNWEDHSFQAHTKFHFEHIKPEPSRAPMVFKMNVIRDVLSKFFPSLQHQQPLQQQTVATLLKSPELTDFGPADYVFVLITMDDANWDKKTTPDAVRSFISSFLNVKLPPEAPNFYFFFGVEYAQNEETKRIEVEAAIENRLLGGDALPELTPVTASDITAWFSRYSTAMVPPDLEPSDMTNKEFPNTEFPNMESLDMKKVVNKLEKLININNKKAAEYSHHSKSK